MKSTHFILSIFISSLFTVSCDQEDGIDFSNKNARQLDFTNDIIDDGLAAKANGGFVSKSLTFKYLGSDVIDTDNDGIADYAESNINSLDPNQFDDLLSMDPSTILTISTVDGIQQVPLYKTSFYQEKMLEFNISSFHSNYPWTDTQKERVKYYFFAVKKI